MLFQIVRNSFEKARGHCAYVDSADNIKYADQLFAALESELCTRLGVEFHWNVVLAQAEYNKIGLATNKYMNIYETREAVYKKFPTHIKALFA